MGAWNVSQGLAPKMDGRPELKIGRELVPGVGMGISTWEYCGSEWARSWAGRDSVAAWGLRPHVPGQESVLQRTLESASHNLSDAHLSYQPPLSLGAEACL